MGRASLLYDFCSFIVYLINLSILAQLYEFLHFTFENSDKFPLRDFTARYDSNCVKNQFQIEEINFKLKSLSGYAIIYLWLIGEERKVLVMTVNYNKLWKMLIDKNMMKKDLREAAGVTTNVMAKLGKNEHVSTEVLCKICEALNCEIDDIMDIQKES